MKIDITPPLPSLTTEIRLNDDGTLDEVVAWGFVHLEQMSECQWALLIDTADGKRLRVPIYAKGRGFVLAFAEQDGASDLWARLVGDYRIQAAAGTILALVEDEILLADQLVTEVNDNNRTIARLEEDLARLRAALAEWEGERAALRLVWAAFAEQLDDGAEIEAEVRGDLRAGSQRLGCFSIPAAQLQHGCASGDHREDAPDAALRCGAAVREGNGMVFVEAAVEVGEFAGGCQFH